MAASSSLLFVLLVDLNQGVGLEDNRVHVMGALGLKGKGERRVGTGAVGRMKSPARGLAQRQLARLKVLTIEK